MSRNRLLWIERNLSLAERIEIYSRIVLPELKFNARVFLSPRADSNFRLRCKVLLVAFRDYIFRRFGDCPTWIRII